MPQSDIYIGLMTGTSMDGIDAVLARINDEHFTLLASLGYPLHAGLSDDILALCQPGHNELERAGLLQQQLSREYLTATRRLLDECGVSPEQVSAIGCHGQTVRHCPGDNGFSIQLLCADTLAAGSGIPVVSNFRNKDMILGGQGAPLVPRFHQRLFSQANTRTAVVNIGGMANATLLDGANLVGGFDTGPGNVLLDGWIHKQREQRYDNNGDWAATGQTNPSLLERLLNDPYFRQPPPKSTGREHFNLAWLEQKLSGLTLPDEDVQATLTALTADSIADALSDFAPQRILLCGGGAHNQELTRRLQAACRAPVCSSEDMGLHPDWVEAAAFAWLAWARLAGKPGNAPVVTGASREAVLGQITLP